MLVEIPAYNLEIKLDFIKLKKQFKSYLMLQQLSLVFSFYELHNYSLQEHCSLEVKDSYEATINRIRRRGKGLPELTLSPAQPVLRPGFK